MCEVDINCKENNVMENNNTWREKSVTVEIKMCYTNKTVGKIKIVIRKVWKLKKKEHKNREKEKL